MNTNPGEPRNSDMVPNIKAVDSVSLFTPKINLSERTSEILNWLVIFVLFVIIKHNGGFLEFKISTRMALSDS